MKIKDNTGRKFSMLIAHLCLIPVLDYAKQSFITGFTGAFVVTSTQNNWIIRAFVVTLTQNHQIKFPETLCGHGDRLIILKQQNS